MGYNNGFISAPVSIYDVQKTLGASSSDLGTLCRSAYVNKWAKYKPVPNGIINTTPQLNSDKTWKKTGNDQATWWKGHANNCGLSYTSQTSIGNVKTNIDAKRVVWSRIIPTGNYAEPYRLLDFNEYNHRAFPPTYALAVSDAQMKTGETMRVQVATSTDDGYCIKFSHVGVFNNYYYTIAVYDKTNDSLSFVYSDTKKVGDYSDAESVEFEIPYNNGTTGYQNMMTQGHSYKAYLFLSSVRYKTVTTSLQSGTYVPLPCGEGDYGMQPAEFKCVNSSQWAYIDAYCPLNGNIVNWTIDLFGAGQPSDTTLVLKDLRGNPISGQSVSINFSSGATAVTSAGGVSGWRKKSNIQSSLKLPTNNPEMYKLEFYVVNTLVGTGMIGHDLNPSV